MVFRILHCAWLGKGFGEGMASFLGLMIPFMTPMGKIVIYFNVRF